MCGIAGAITRFPIDEEKLNNAKKQLKKRGPDNSSHSVNKLDKGFYITLLHTRLSILDLDKRSDQPMRYKNINLIFNGEIYNYLELKKELNKNFNFETNSDTEVLLKQIYKKGLPGINECEGMFALAFFDFFKNKLFLARDRFGEKPLYYFQNNDKSIYFGSEPKAIFALLGFQLSVNTDHLRRFMVNGYKSLYKKNNTFFEGLEELKPGHCLEINPFENKIIYPWFTQKYLSQNNDMSYEEAVEGTRIRLLKSMELRLRSDVPIAFCLSGGIDSNGLIGIAKKIFGYDVHGFTIMNHDERYEEKDMVNYSVKSQELKHTSIAVEKNNFFENLKNIVNYHDSPVSTISYYAHWLLMKSISQEGYKVSVSGTGADEIFSGYYDHHLAYIAEMNNGNKSFFNESISNWENNIETFVRNPFLKNSNYFINNPMSRSHIYLDTESYGKYLTYPFKEEFEEKIYTPFLLRNRMANELFHETVPVILHEDDLNAMYFSIENRSPFLDSKLYHWSLQLPTRFLINKSLSKAVLRDSLKDIVPTRILKNPRKIGFNVPIDDYIDFSDPKIISMLTQPSRIDEIVKSDQIKMLFQNKQRSNEESKFLFNYLSTRSFLDSFA